MSHERQHARVDYSANVELVVEGAVQAARTLNLSQGGAFIETAPAPPLESRVVLRISLPGVPDRSEIGCIVRWGKAGGIGLQFQDLRAIEVWALNRLLKSLQAK